MGKYIDRRNSTVKSKKVLIKGIDRGIAHRVLIEVSDHINVATKYLKVPKEVSHKRCNKRYRQKRYRTKRYDKEVLK